MVDLKTLKELTFEVEMPNQDGFKEVVELFDLREEAINWVKQIEKDIKKIEHTHTYILDVPLATKTKLDGLLATRQWIIHFFDITEK